MINKNYFKYLLKSLYPLIIVSAIIGILTLGLFPALNYISEHRENICYINKIPNYLPITMCMAFSLPLVIHGRYFSKNSSDIYLSLPINRKQAFITENLFGLMTAVGSALIGFFVGLMFTGLANMELYLIETYGQIFQTLPIILLAVTISYLMSNVAVNFSNSVIEAVTMTICVLVVSLMIFGIFDTYFAKHLPSSFDRIQLSCFSFGPGVAMVMISNFVRYNTVECGYSWYWQGLASLGINLVVWVGLSFFAFNRFVRLKSEHLGTANMEMFGGPDAHALTFGLIYVQVGNIITESFDGYAGSNMLTLISFLAATIGYWVSLFILRRKIVFYKSDLLRFAISALGGICIGVVLKVLNG